MAVSYTHLDVYKRQGQRFLEGDVAPVDVVGYFRLQEVAIEVYPHEKGAEISYLAVSYTHLDVYKRQDWLSWSFLWGHSTL